MVVWEKGRGDIGTKKTLRDVSLADMEIYLVYASQQLRHLAWAN